MGEGNRGRVATKHTTHLPLDRDLSKMLVARLIKGSWIIMLRSFPTVCSNLER
jgi:hypothetical protein